MVGIINKNIRIRGIVQGVGFRPFIFRIAYELNIKGFVRNDTMGVFINAEGPAFILDSFLQKIKFEAPALAEILELYVEEGTVQNYKSFAIRDSESSSLRDVFFSPDVAVCDECLEEFFDASNRRKSYPFITCINCGPRFSIIKDIPYDRDKTTMDVFPLCDECESEYRDPVSRRFHAQPIACSSCGPMLTLSELSGKKLSNDTEEISRMAVNFIKQGKIIAMKGVGGYLLACDAQNDSACEELRARKRRPFKPFAVMAASVEKVREFANVSQKEEELLKSKERPILLLKIKRSQLSSLVAPHLSSVGVMLPYLPFQHLLFHENSSMILVMTSGNLAEEPIVYENDAAFTGFSQIADYIISYNRDIIAQNDDSVLFVEDEVPYFVRRSRGYVPKPFLTTHTNHCILASGGDLKNTFALSKNNFTIVSQHLGDMAHPQTQDTFKSTLEHYIHLFDAKPNIIVSDMHPGYMTTAYCDELASHDTKRLFVQHHHAHIAAVIEEYSLEGKVLGIAFDGTGYGLDGTLWGSEFLVADKASFVRALHFSNFQLPGGENAIRDVWKIGLSLLYQLYGANIPKDVLEKMNFPYSDAVIEIMEKRINCPKTCSIGRLFDGISSLLGLSRQTSSEAEAAIMLEEAASRGSWNEPVFVIPQNDDGLIDTASLTAYILKLIDEGFNKADIALSFHLSLAETVLQNAKNVCTAYGINRVALSGGVFCNRILLKRVKDALIDADIEVFVSKVLPVNDGCISYGQTAVAKALLSY